MNSTYSIAVVLLAFLGDIWIYGELVACSSSKVFCAVDKKDSGIPANFAAFYRYQHSSRTEMQTHNSMRISIHPGSKFVLIAKRPVLMVGHQHRVMK
jgi:hypothetical protein